MKIKLVLKKDSIDTCQFKEKEGAALQLSETYLQVARETSEEKCLRRRRCEDDEATNVASIYYSLSP